jgi:hypothetical protein
VAQGPANSVVAERQSTHRRHSPAWLVPFLIVLAVVATAVFVVADAAARRRRT